MMKIKSLLSLALAAVLSFAVGVTVCAHEVSDMSRTGTITVKMEYNGEAVLGGTLTAYRIGDVYEENGNCSFVKSEAMADFPGDYGNIFSEYTAKEADAYVKEHNVSSCAEAMNENGKAVFYGLEQGLYLIVQTTASHGCKPLTSFIVGIPMNENGSYIYDINAEGKFEMESIPEPNIPTPSDEPGEIPEPDIPTPSDEPGEIPEPDIPTPSDEPGEIPEPDIPTPSDEPGEIPEPDIPTPSDESEEIPEPYIPTPSDEPTLPKTGQLNWPVPALAFLGVVLFLVGFALRFGKKETNDKA